MQALADANEVRQVFQSASANLALRAVSCITLEGVQRACKQQMEALGAGFGRSFTNTAAYPSLEVRFEEQLSGSTARNVNRRRMPQCSKCMALRSTLFKHFDINATIPSFKRALCSSMPQSHGLQEHFCSHNDIDATIPWPAGALCSHTLTPTMQSHLLHEHFAHTSTLMPQSHGLQERFVHTATSMPKSHGLQAPSAHTPRRRCYSPVSCRRTSFGHRHRCHKPIVCRNSLLTHFDIATLSSLAGPS